MSGPGYLRIGYLRMSGRGYLRMSGPGYLRIGYLRMSGRGYLRMGRRKVASGGAGGAGSAEPAKGGNARCGH
eukprot:scaffold12349_cov87-Isochrysis_galbana.AAC.2